MFACGWRWMVCLALPGCVEYRLDRDPSPPPDPPDTDPQEVEPTECAVAVSPRGTVEVLAECRASPQVVEDPWNVVVEWRYLQDWGGAVLPAVAHITDDNDDGVVDDRDVPDVLFSTDKGLTVLHGDGSGVIATLVPGSGVAGADLDGDGRGDIVVKAHDYGVYAYDATGTRMWNTGEIDDLSRYAQVTAADLDGDGDVEVVADCRVLEGATGGVLARLDGVAAEWRAPVVADLDGDGRREIVLGEDVFDHEGTLLWSAPITGRGAFSAVVDADGDPDREVVFVSGSSFVLVDADGSLLAEAVVPGSDPGPPCVADFDGDGDPEVAVPAETALSLVELDGTIVWTTEARDPTGLAGCSAADLDLDGVAEIIYADHEDVRILDGRTGIALATLSDHYGLTLFEYPVVADVDRDGAAEIVVVSNASTEWRGVTVYGHAGGGWARVPGTWPVHDYAATSDTFRAQPTLDQPDRAELRASITDACVDTCDGGLVRISWQIANHGAAASADGTRVVLLGSNGGTERVLRVVSMRSLAPGEADAGVVFEVAAAEVEGLRLGIEVENAGGCYDRPHRVVQPEPICP